MDARTRVMWSCFLVHVNRWTPALYWLSVWARQWCCPPVALPFLSFCSTVITSAGVKGTAWIWGDVAQHWRLICIEEVAIHNDREIFPSDQVTTLRVPSFLHRANTDPRQCWRLVKDSLGNILSNENDCFICWREHLSQLLNHSSIPEDITLNPENLNI